MAALLIVEDDKQTNEAICEYLKSAGHKIIPAYDGSDALQTFNQGNIDPVVLDIMLPKITGLAVLHEIRKKCKSIAATDWNEQTKAEEGKTAILPLTRSLPSIQALPFPLWRSAASAPGAATSAAKSK